jgi:hypothetical protein
MTLLLGNFTIMESEIFGRAWPRFCATHNLDGFVGAYCARFIFQPAAPFPGIVEASEQLEAIIVPPKLGNGIDLRLRAFSTVAIATGSHDSQF